MRQNFKLISIHIISWCLLLLIPFFSTYQAVQSIAPEINKFSYLPIFIISSINIIMFYANYFWMIPNYIFTKKYVQYALSFFGILFFCIIVSMGVLRLSGINPKEIEASNPTILIIRPIANMNAFLMLLITFVTALVLSYGNRLKQMEQEKLSAEIASLKSQINPHFLFNTLNNIYATAIESSPRTAEMLEKLAEMMRYTMGKTQEEFVSLSDEINYIENYIELQKLRLNNNVKLDFQLDSPDTDVKIAPMLLIPFIENAFKHGVNPEQESEIYILLSCTQKKLRLMVSNTIVEIQRETSERSGLGTLNTSNRLKLIYPGLHSLNIQRNDKEFNVLLQITLV